MLALLIMKTGLPSWAAKIIEGLILIGILLGSLWYFGHHEYDKGKSEQLNADAIVLKGYADQLKAATQKYDDDMAAQKKASDEKYNNLLATDQAALLDNDKTIAQLKKDLHHEISKRADKAAITDNVFTAGFVYVHDRPLAAEVAGVSTSDPVNADAPTGLDASTVALNDASNNSECVIRGKVIKDWQDWYAVNSSAWAVFAKDQPNVPVVPVLH
jgi:hypothetical protein